ncbi:MAG: T9SS type A sorting domain-containing protein [Candidatus Kapaibacteriota bacterium]
MPLHTQPRPVSPLHTAFVADTVIQIQWSPVFNATKYEVAIGWDSAFVLPTVQTFSATQATIAIRRSTLPYVNTELTAFWKVRALTGDNSASVWSEVWRFTMAKPKILPPILQNQIQDKQLVATSAYLVEDRIELESRIWRVDDGRQGTSGYVFFNPNIPLDTLAQFTPQNLEYSVESDQPSVVSARIVEADSTVIYDSFRRFRPTLYYKVGEKANSFCQLALITLTAKNSFGWSSQCLFQIFPRRPIGETNNPTSVRRPSGLTIVGKDQNQFINLGQIPINQSTTLSFAVLKNNLSTIATLHFPATKGVEFTTSRNGLWQQSLRIDWKEGEPKPDSIWVRYTPPSIGQNLSIVRSETPTDSCAELYSVRFLQFEAIAVQPQPYSYRTPVGIRSEDKRLRANIDLSYTNPATNEALFRLNLPKPSKVKLTVYTLLGKVIETLTNGELLDGQYTFAWTTNSFPSGVYGYRLEVNNEMQAGFINVVH